MGEATESSKYRHLTTKYLSGNGVDLGCGGCPVVPWAIAFDLPNDDYLTYHSNHQGDRTIQFGGDARDLPFKDGTLDFVFSSHLIEDFLDWNPVLIEWKRVLKPGGRLVILVPDKNLWKAALDSGQPPNCAHQHESFVGELSQHAAAIGGLCVIEDRLTECHPGDYSIIFAATKV